MLCVCVVTSVRCAAHVAMCALRDGACACRVSHVSVRQSSIESYIFGVLSWLGILFWCLELDVLMYMKILRLYRQNDTPSRSRPCGRERVGVVLAVRSQKNGLPSTGHLVDPRAHPPDRQSGEFARHKRMPTLWSILAGLRLRRTQCLADDACPQLSRQWPLRGVAISSRRARNGGCAGAGGGFRLHQSSTLD
jgi:hypothetical protein